jgi:hypothetical protein
MARIPQRLYVFIGLRPNKIWETLYLVYEVFSALRLSFNYISHGHHTRPFFALIFIIYSSHFDIFSKNFDLSFLPTEKSLIVQIDRPER